MEHPHHTEQKNLDARAFTLCNISAQLLEQGFYVRPPNIGRNWPRIDQFDGTLMFASHEAMVSIISTTLKRVTQAGSWLSIRCFSKSAEISAKQFQTVPLNHIRIREVHWWVEKQNAPKGACC